MRSAVLVDLDNSKLVAILPRSSQEIIKKVLNSWGEEILQQIEEVSIDLWIDYKNLVEELIPNAQVVADTGQTPNCH
ncbi:MAG: transposase [Rivularia sp. (in: cyanobacteria)]